MKPQANPEKRFILAVRECWIHAGHIPEDNTAHTPEDKNIIANSRNVINEVLDSLYPNEAKVLRMRFGLETGVAYTLREIGKQFNCTPERIRQIEFRALRKISHPSRRERILRLEAK